MAQYTIHRRRLATPEEEQPAPPSLIPSSKDPALKRHPRNSSTLQYRQCPDHPVVPSSRQSYMFSPSPKQNPVLTKAKSLKHYKGPTFLDNLFQAKSTTLSADFGAPGGAQVEPSRPKQQTKSKADDPEVKEEIKKSNFKETTEGEKVKVKTSQEDGKKDVYFVVKGSKGKDFKDPVGDGHLDLRRLSFGGGGGRRRSFCGAHVELRDFLANNGAKVVAVDMPPFMQVHAVDCARMTHDSLEKFSSRSLALTLKKEFDGVYGPAWHCIVGTSFGSFVTHSVGGFLYFSMDQKLYILLFKTTVQRAE